MGKVCHLSAVCLLLCLPMLITAVPVSNHVDVENVEVQLINEVSNARQKRSAIWSNLPEHLSFNVPVAGENVVLRLKRAKLLPTWTSDGKLEPLSEESAVYTDQSRESAMIVKRSSNDYKLSGTFSHANEAWNLEPASRHTRSTPSHQLSPLRASPKQVISFVGDEFYDTEERPEHIANHHNRSKRAVTQHVIELAFVADYEDYSKWVDLVGASNALAEMRLWFTYVSESINIRYASIQDSTISINTKTDFLRILTNPSEATFISNLVTNGQFSGSAGLGAFRSWIVSQRPGFPVSDHYMLFTGFDIIGATGIAFSRRVCTDSGVSISEDTFQGTLGGIAAHELGHSLSAEHDTDEGCSDADDFIMAASLSTPVDAINAGNPWKFSSCSISKFADYLKDVTCTLPENTSSDEELPPPAAGDRAGEVLSRDQQCVRVFQDTNSFYCESVQQQFGGVDQLCGGMYCFIPGGGGFCQTTLPQEYTTCGTNKWCVRGVCVDVQEETTPVPTTAAPTTPTTQKPTTAAPTTPTTQKPTTAAPTTPTTQKPTTAAPTTPTTAAPTTPTTQKPTTAAPTTPTTAAPTTPTTQKPTTAAPTTTQKPSTAAPTTTQKPTTTVPTTTQKPTTAAPTTTQKPSTAAPTTTQKPTTAVPTTTREPTTAAPTTTTRDPRPNDVYDCIIFIYRRDWTNWWRCVRYVVFRQNQQREEQQRRQRGGQRDREQERDERRRPSRPNQPRRRPV